MDNSAQLNPPTPPPQPAAKIPPQPVHPKNSSRKRLLLCLLVILIVLGSGAYVLTSNKQQMTNNSTHLVVSPTPTPDPTAGWKAYSNSEYGFSLKYPPQYEASSSPKMLFYARSQTGGSISIYTKSDSINNYSFMDVGGTTHKFDSSKKIWTNNSSNTSSDPIKMNTPFEAYRYGIGDGGCGGEAMIIPHPTKTLILQISTIHCVTIDESSGQAVDPVDDLTAEELLSTFKFTR